MRFTFCKKKCSKTAQKLRQLVSLNNETVANSFLVGLFSNNIDLIYAKI